MWRPVIDPSACRVSNCLYSPGWQLASSKGQAQLGRKARVTGGVLLIVLALLLLVAGLGAFAATGSPDSDAGTGIVGVIAFAMWVVAALVGWAGWRLVRPRRCDDEARSAG